MQNTLRQSHSSSISVLSGGFCRVSGALLFSVLLAVAALGIGASQAQATVGVDPVVTITSPNDGDEFATNNVAATFAIGGDETVTSVTCKVGLITVLGFCTSPFQPPFVLTEGPQTYEVTVTDDEGDSATDSVSFTVDTAPVIDFHSTSLYTTTQLTNDLNFSIFDEDLDPASVMCDLDDDALAAEPCIAVASDAFAFSSIYTPGTHVLTVTASDTSVPVQHSTQTYTIHFEPTLEDGAITVDMTRSTTKAARHPDLTVDIQNSTGEDPESLQFDLPAGFVGSLKAVTDKCQFPKADLLDTSQTHTSADLVNPSLWCPDQATLDASQIGTVMVEGLVDDSTTKLKGKVYLTEGSPTAPGELGEAAGIVIDIPAKVDGLDLGHVVAAARLKVRTQYGVPTDEVPDEVLFDHPNPNNPAQIIQGNDYAQNPAGVNTYLENIPNTITSAHGTSDFTLKRARMHLRSVEGSPSTSPLLTNESTCAHKDIPVVMTTHQRARHEITEPWDTTACLEQPFAPDIDISFGVDSLTHLPIVPSAGQSTAATVTVTVPDGSTTLNETTVVFPRSLKPNVAAFTDLCLLSDLRQTPPTCDEATSLMGTFSVESPLLSEPVAGKAYMYESGSALPKIYLYAENRDLGIRVRAISSAPTVAGGAFAGISATFAFDIQNFGVPLPDLPISKLTMELDGPTDPHILPFVVESTGPNDGCLARDYLAFRAMSHSGRVHVGTKSVAFSGCTDNGINIAEDVTGTFVGGDVSGMTGTTDQPKPVLSIQSPAGSFTSGYPKWTCALDNSAVNGTQITDGALSTPVAPDFMVSLQPTLTGPSVAKPCGAVGTTNWKFTPPNNLDDGVHSLVVQRNDNATIKSRFFVFTVNRSDDDAIRDNEDQVAPVAAITSAALTTITSYDSLPAISFDAGGEDHLDFQCRIDGDEAFQPCASDTTGGSFDLDDAVDEPQIGTHTFEVRAEDATGNLGPATSQQFTIDIPFGPQFKVELDDGDPSTNAQTSKARSHPKLDLTLTSRSNIDLKSLNFSMPRGFVGSLLGAVTRCSAPDAAAAVADTGACPQSSKVGTVTASAQADLSTVVQHGEVFITDPLQAGDPAGLVISIRAKVGAVDFGTIAVRQRLIVRGNAEGVDTISLDDVPRSIKGTRNADGTVVNADEEVAFHFRKLVLHLVGGTGATQKLLTSPSDCTPSAFSATFASYGVATSAASQPYAATDCASLPFYTAFTASIKDIKDGSIAEPGDVATMTATVAASPDDSGVKRAEITLPTALTADAGGIPLGCEVAVYEATKVCPESTVVGTAVATTPILPTPLEGKVYFGRPKPGSFVVPGYDETLRLIIQLRGLVSIDLIGKTTLKDNKAITVFENIPDAPVNTFTVTVNKVVKVRKDACDKYASSRTIVGNATSYNDKSSPYNADVNIKCDGKATYKATVSGKGKKAKATINVKASSGSRLRTVTLSLPKGLTPIKRGLKKGLVIKADGRTLKAKCFKLRQQKLVINFCGGTPGTADIKFNVGSLNLSKKLKRAPMKMVSVFANGKSETVTLILSGKKFGTLNLQRAGL